MARASKKTASKKKTRSRSQKKKNMISVDFDGVESGGGMPVPDGNYTAQIVKIEQKEGESSGEPYLSCQWKISEGKLEGRKIFDNISLQPQSLWRFRTILENIGYETEDGEMEIDPADLLEEDCGIEVVNEEYDGKDRPRITGFLPADGVEEESEEEEEEEPEEEEEEEPEEEPKKKRGKKKTGKAKKIRVGSKVKFEDEEGDTVKGVVTEMDDDDNIWVEDSSGDNWEVELSEVTAV